MPKDRTEKIGQYKMRAGISTSLSLAGRGEMAEQERSDSDRKSLRGAASRARHKTWRSASGRSKKPRMRGCARREKQEGKLPRSYKSLAVERRAARRKRAA